MSSNLFEALHFLCKARGRPPGIPFWIDAISINQNNDSGRSEQVVLMKEIYTKAHKVWVWLGLPSESTELALAKLLAIQSNMNTKFLIDNAEPSSASDDIELDSSLVEEFRVFNLFPGAWSTLLVKQRSCNDEEWRSILEILQSPWWLVNDSSITLVLISVLQEKSLDSPGSHQSSLPNYSPWHYRACPRQTIASNFVSSYAWFGFVHDRTVFTLIRGRATR